MSAPIPIGIYELKYAAGKNWYGQEYLFGTSTSYAKYPKLVNFTETNRIPAELTIELIHSQFGMLITEIISEYDF